MLLTVALYVVFGAAFGYAMWTLWGRVVPSMINWWSMTYETSAELGFYTLAFLGIAILYLAYTTLSNFYLSPISETDATPASADDYPDLHRTVERLALEMDLPKPNVGIVDSPVPNAYTHGLVPSRSTVVVTNGLLEDLDEDELEAVVAHELAHISNRDAAVMSLGFLLPAVTFAFTKAVTTPFESDDPHSRSSKRRSSGSSGPVFVPSGGGSGGNMDEDTIKALLVLLAIIIVTAVLTFAISAVFYLFTTLTLILLSRTRELSADRAAAAVTGKPYALESAIKTIDGRMDELPAKDLREIDGAVETVYFASLDRGVFNREDARLLTEDLFPNTHPPIDRRVEAVREVAPE